MSSFYGGKQGKSWNIVHTYASIASMVSDFSDPTSTQASFGQFVIVSTSDRSNPQNGCLYRRGLNYNESISTASTTSTDYIEKPGAGAVYVGRIAGPAGASPYFELSSIGTAAASVGTPSTSIVNIPDNNGNNSTVSISFKFPTPSFSATASTVSAYTAPSATVTANSSNAYLNTIGFSLPVNKQPANLSASVSNGTGYQKKVELIKTSYQSSASGSASTIATVNLPYVGGVSLNSTTGQLTTTVGNTPSTIGTIVYPTTMSATGDKIYVTYNNSTQAVPLGELSSQFHVYGDYASTAALADALPNGFTDANKAGWIVTVTNGSSKDFYAYDLNSTHSEVGTTRWYKIGGINESAISVPPFIAISSDQPNNLKENGIWLVSIT